ncbi:hypothetical protein Amn_pd00070 (plasmid) [Aminobacter sp. Y103A]|uniref:hypothetical protein n=1 Tax=Aminobacter sp. Y103A TaxID=1870862 RepID=UPI00257481CF|nr:hypothetical protein [Aminobacter sp. SS-2016]BBD41454.1 hypothetical protein Amn_pd00070 [Aminobacter sp. SS-2016]
MSPEDVARAYQFREGFRLIDYGEVGLPIFRLTIEAVTTSHRILPTISEFVMRCLSLGETQEKRIAGMLGLKPDIVKSTIDTLVAEGFVARQISTDFQSFKLTNAGDARLLIEREEVPQEEMLVIDYDGIQRLPIRLAGESVVRASELKSGGAVEIRPYPADPPTISELNIPDVTKVIRRQGGEDFRRNVLALKRIVRRSNVFRQAIALVYMAEKGKEIQIGFALDGKLSEPHERAFAEHGGPRKMGFVKAIEESEGRRRLDRLVGRSIVAALPHAEDIRALRLEEATARGQVRSIAPAVQSDTRPRRANPAHAALLAAKERHKVAQHGIDALPVRTLAPYEQGELLEEALKTAASKLVVSTAGVQSVIVNGFMLRDVDSLISQQVDIEIYSMVAPQSEPRQGNTYDPLSELTRRSVKGFLRLTQTKPKEIFFLLKDNDLAVVSNRPFLGEMVRRSGFRRVEGVVTRRPEYVDAIRSAMTHLLGGTHGG